MNTLVELLRHLKPALGIDVGDLVARGVTHHARMAPILAHHVVCHVAPGVGEVLGEVTEALRLSPHVANLVQHEDAQLVAGVKQLLRGMVVGAANGVEAGFLEPCNTPELELLVRHTTKNSLVVV